MVGLAGVSLYVSDFPLAHMNVSLTSCQKGAWSLSNHSRCRYAHDMLLARGKAIEVLEY